ncbi:UNVERIFIED_CONTAM: RagB/SusD family nutrient uptake outer membrane protein, partial [Prevotella sp. 15_C9]
ANPMQPLHREEDVLELVIRDLTYAVENLPEVATAKGRVNAWGAKGMLAKVYLARSGWKGGTRDNADLEKAKELAADVINNSGISLYENYEDLFK